MTTSQHIKDIASQFSDATIISIEKIEDGAINDTYIVKAENQENNFILQHMHGMFPTFVMDNLALLSPILKEGNVMVPFGLQTKEGLLCIKSENNRWWRGLSYIPGVTINDTISQARAYSAGKLIGSFHDVLAQQELTIESPLPMYHNMTDVMQKFRNAYTTCTDERKIETLTPLVAQAEELYLSSTIDMSKLPKRVIHADLKVSNIRFEGEEAIAIIDMDTMMHHTLAVELGDMLRSWCGVNGEDDPNQIFDANIAKEALRGYFETARFITQEEKESIVQGIGHITFELGTRFLTDAFTEDYFRLQPKYSSLFEQQTIRATNQYALLADFKRKQESLLM